MPFLAFKFTINDFLECADGYSYLLEILLYNM